MKKFAKLLVIVFAMALAFSATACGGKSDTEKMVEKVNNALENTDVANALDASYSVAYVMGTESFVSSGNSIIIDRDGEQKIYESESSVQGTEVYSGEMYIYDGYMCSFETGSTDYDIMPMTFEEYFQDADDSMLPLLSADNIVSWEENTEGEFTIYSMVLNNADFFDAAADIAGMIEDAEDIGISCEVVIDSSGNLKSFTFVMGGIVEEQTISFSMSIVINAIGDDVTLDIPTPVIEAIAEYVGAIDDNEGDNEGEVE